MSLLGVGLNMSKLFWKVPGKPPFFEALLASVPVVHTGLPESGRSWQSRWQCRLDARPHTAIFAKEGQGLGAKAGAVPELEHVLCQVVTMWSRGTH